MLLEEITNTEFPYFRHQKLFVLPPRGFNAIHFFDIAVDDVVEATPANGLGLHCLVLEIRRDVGRVKVRFFGDVEREFIVGGDTVPLTGIDGVKNLARYTAKEFYDTFNRSRLHLENGVVGWLTFENHFIALESDEYARHMSEVTSSDALTWEDSDLGNALDAYTSSDAGERNLEGSVGARLGGGGRGAEYVAKIQNLLPDYGGRRKADRGRLHVDSDESKAKKRKARAPQANTKIEQAVAIYRSSKKLPREEVVMRLQKALGVTHSNASTYFSKAKGIVERGGTREAWERSGY